MSEWVKLLSHVRLFATPWTVAYLPGSSLHGILQARVLEWVAISFSRGSSLPRDRTRVSRIPGRCFNLWATREAMHDHYFGIGCTNCFTSVIPVGYTTASLTFWSTYHMYSITSTSFVRTKKKEELHDPDNHNGVITHLEPDILKCEVKWALESITMNKASGGDGIHMVGTSKR